MKKVILLAILMPFMAFSQSRTGYVGLNTSTPNATLDVQGVPTDPTKFDGVIAPRLTGPQLAAKNYGLLQTGSIVYVTVIPKVLTGQVANISKKGYYYFDGTIWQSYQNDTLSDVVKRGNHSPSYITFTGGDTGEAERDGAFGMNLSTYSYFFGNMNPAQTGLYNIGFGYNVFPLLSTGKYNSAFGHYSASSLTTASYGTFFGYGTGNKTTTGNSNSFFGDESGYNTTTGHKNSFFGVGSGYHSTTGSFNSVFGYKAGQTRTLGNFNVLIGHNAGTMPIPTVTALGNNNVLIGAGAGFGDTNLNNKLIIHSNTTLSSPDTNSPTNEGIYTNPSQSQLANALVTGDFVDRWFRINGKLQLNQSLINTSTASYTKLLVFNPTTGDVATGDSSEFLTRTGTGINRPLTGDLEFTTGGNGFYSQTATKIGGFTITDDDENPSPIIYNTNKNTGAQIKIELQDAGIYLTGEILGDPTFPIPRVYNSLVQRQWVEDYVNSRITVPAPPATGNYVLTSVNGVMQWIAN